MKYSEIVRKSLGCRTLYLPVEFTNEDGDRCPANCPLLVSMGPTSAKCSNSFGSRHNELRTVYWGNELYRSDYKDVYGEMRTGFLRAHKCPLKTLNELGIEVEEELDI